MNGLPRLRYVSLVASCTHPTLRPFNVNPLSDKFRRTAKCWANLWFFILKKKDYCLCRLLYILIIYTATDLEIAAEWSAKSISPESRNASLHTWFRRRFRINLLQMSTSIYVKNWTHRCTRIINIPGIRREYNVESALKRFDCDGFSIEITCAGFLRGGGNEFF